MLRENRILRVSQSTIRSHYSHIVRYIDNLEKKHKISYSERQKLDAFVRSLYVARRTNEQLNNYLEKTDNTIMKRINYLLNRLSKIH